MSNNEKYVCVNCVEQISKKDAEIAALLKQWNDLDRRNEVRHREWNTKLTEKDAEIERLRKELKLVSEDHAMRKEVSDVGLGTGRVQ